MWLVSSHQQAVLHTWQPSGIQMGPAHQPTNHSPAAGLSTNEAPGGRLRRGQLVMVADPSVTPEDSGLVGRERGSSQASSVATQHFHLSSLAWLGGLSGLETIICYASSLMP